MNRNNHTTSKKCQYKIPASNIRCWLFVKWYANRRHKPLSKNAVPIIQIRGIREKSLTIVIININYITRYIKIFDYFFQEN